MNTNTQIVSETSETIDTVEASASATTETSIVDLTSDAAFDKKIAASEELDRRVLELLIQQYKAAGGSKRPFVLQKIAKHINELQLLLNLPVAIPLVCVGNTRLEAATDLILAAIAVVPYLHVAGGKVSTWSENDHKMISCALADTFKVAASKRVLEMEIQNLRKLTETRVDTDKERKELNAAIRRHVEEMAVSVSTFHALLEVTPTLVLEPNKFGKLWINDIKEPGKPLSYMFANINMIGSLIPFLRDEDRPAFQISFANAIKAINERTRNPLLPRRAVSMEQLEDEVKFNS
jgi:hypothetical protein